jgi:hypothetical protein
MKTRLAILILLEVVLAYWLAVVPGFYFNPALDSFEHELSWFQPSDYGAQTYQKQIQKQIDDLRAIAARSKRWSLV